MYSVSKIVSTTVLLLMITFAFGATTHYMDASELIEGQVIITVAGTYGVEQLIEDFDGVSLDTIVDINTFLISFPDSLPVDSVIQILLPRPGVLAVQPNFILGVPEVNQISQSFPDESQPVFLRGESPPSFYEQPGTYSIGLDSAHLIATGQGVVVAVIDNGLKLTHPLFDGALEDTGYDFVDHDFDPSEEPGVMYGHGTFVSGLVLLSAPDCKLVPFRAFDENGLGNSFNISKAIYQAAEGNVDIINMSFGLYQEDPLVAMAVDDAHEQGIAMIASVGNDSTSQQLFPAACTEVMAVSAIDTLELIAGFSNYGDYVDVCAPGVNVYSSLAGECEWGTWSGTSFSTPLVSGICALVLEQAPTLTAGEIYETIRLSARTELNWGTVIPPDQYYGYGCIDAFRALTAWTCGDANNSQRVNIADLTYLVQYLFRGGPPPPIMEAADVNGDSRINVADLNHFVSYLFASGPELICPE